MTPTPRPLPEPLRSSTFSTAEALERGVHAERLRRADLEQRVHGARGPLGSADDLWGRCRLFAARLPPSAFFSHSTAARLLGAPVPTRYERMRRLHVSVPAPHRAPHAQGLIGHSRAILPHDILDVEGLRMSAPARMFCEMAVVLDLPRLVMVADHLIRRDRPLCSLDDLWNRRHAGDRLSRARRISTALEMASDRAESPPESFFRVLFTLAGIPPTEANLEVTTSFGRRFRVDFAWLPQKVAVEYQGAYHLDPEQRRLDMTKRAQLEGDRWTVVELNADDLLDPGSAVERVRTTLLRA